MWQEFLSIAIVLAALPGALAQDARISGTVAYRERIALPPTAQVEVTLEDVSRADAVAMEGANRDLESGYAQARKKPGDPVIVSLEGRVAERPRMEGTGTTPTLVVEKVTKVSPGETCPARFAAAPLQNTYWRLTRLGDVAIARPPNPKQEPSLTFESDTGHFSGSGGCNRMIGSYQVSGNALSMKAAGTMMACPSGMETEAAFGKTLSNTRAYRIIGRLLEFYDDQGRLIAKFEAR